MFQFMLYKFDKEVAEYKGAVCLPINIQSYFD